jgi:hypothetical protein
MVLVCMELRLAGLLLLLGLPCSLPEFEKEEKVWDEFVAQKL